MMKSEICLVSVEFPPDTGGAGIVGSQLLRVVSNNYNSVDLVTKQKSNINEEISNVKVYKFKRKHIVWMFSLGMLLRKLVKQNYSNIILNDGDAVLAAILFLPRKEFNKVTFFIHGEDLIKLFSFLNKFVKKRVDSFVSEVFNILAVSDYMKEYSLTNYDFNGKKINKWYAGIDFSLFKPTKEEKKGVINVLTVATIKRSKGYFETLDALEPLLRENKIKWNIIGKEVDVEELKVCIKEKDISQNIIIHPPVTRGELSKLYSVCDVFLLLSNEPESFGLVYVEAQYHGLPVLVPSYGGAKESMNNETGIIVNDRLELREMLGNWKRDKFDRDKVIENAFTFSIEKSGDKLKSFLK